MSDRWQLLLDDQQIMGGKYELPARVLTVFQEEDKYMQEAWARRVDAVNSAAAAEGVAVELDDADEEDDDIDLDDADDVDVEDTDELFGYSATVETVLTRLKLMGFTPEGSRREMAAVLQEDRDLDGDDALYGRTAKDGEPKRYTVSCEDVVAMGLDAYLRSCAHWGPTTVNPNLSELESVCVDRLAFFFEDAEEPRFLLSALLHGQDPTKKLRLDLSDLLGADYFRSTDEISKEALQELSGFALLGAARGVSAGGGGGRGRPGAVATRGVICGDSDGDHLRVGEEGASAVLCNPIQEFRRCSRRRPYRFR